MVAVPEVGDDPSYYPQQSPTRVILSGCLSPTRIVRAAGQYRGNKARDALKASATDLPAYLRGLEMELVWKRFDRIGLQRIVQLINKSNQFNLTTRRYTEEDVLAVMADPDAFGLQLRLIDRFGDNGIIAIISAGSGERGPVYRHWLMSCRVLGRQVESTTLNLIAQQAKALGAPPAVLNAIELRLRRRRKGRVRNATACPERIRRLKKGFARDAGVGFRCPCPRSICCSDHCAIVCLDRFPDKRRGMNTTYGIGDIGMAAFSVFFMQSPSFLAHQRQLEAGHGRSNCTRLFGIAKIPSDNHIRDMLDPAAPTLLRPVFAETIGATPANRRRPRHVPPARWACADRAGRHRVSFLIPLPALLDAGQRQWPDRVLPRHAGGHTGGTRAR